MRHWWTTENSNVVAESESLEQWQRASKFKRQIWGCRPQQTQQARRQCPKATTTDNENGNVAVLGPYCHFRLSVVIAITCWHYFSSLSCGRIPQICRWNFDDICQSSRNISISSFGGRIGISSCQSSSSDSFVDTVVELIMVVSTAISVPGI